MQRRSDSPATVRWTRTAALAGMMLAGASVLAPARAALPALQHQGDVEYVSGGIGIDESTSFKDARATFPLSMTFAQAAQGQGDYVADVKVVVADAHGKPVLDTTSQGPYLLARLPDGKYQVKATYGNQTQTRDVTIAGGHSEPLVFSWRDKAGQP